MSLEFWNSAELEPKRAQKFQLYINGIPTHIVKTAGRPSPDIGTATHNYLDKEFKFPGTVKWDPINVQLIDPIALNAADIVKDILVASGYKWIDDDFVITPEDLATISKKKAVEAMGSVAIAQIDADGNEVDRWELQNGWISKIDNSELDYKSEELTNMTLTITYDFATFERRR
jgi:hypothetical protein